MGKLGTLVERERVASCPPLPHPRLMHPLAVIHHPAMLEHVTGPGHPERPERLEAVVSALRNANLPGVVWREPTPIERADLELVHHHDYLELVDRANGAHASLDPDTPVSPRSVFAAKLAAGAVADSVRMVMSGEAKSAFALVRPPGHHAESGRAMGFCIYNNIAVAAAVALRDFGLKRLLIVDWDVHHGNGTQQIFYARSDVLFASLHQYPLYPGTGAMHEVGEGDGVGCTINLPLAAGSGDDVYLACLRAVVVPIARTYQPELILVSAGFDAHRADPLGAMSVTTKGFTDMCAAVRALAEETCHGRLVLALEGGYNLRALAESVVACASELTATSARQIAGETNPPQIARFLAYFEQFRRA